jgi:hypothetical protein
MGCRQESLRVVAGRQVLGNAPPLNDVAGAMTAGRFG